jgi:hypothetical protein
LPRSPFWIAIALVFLAFALLGSGRSPVPGVNEPHYLSKARHFWEPAWCARDLFLESSNPHWVFYATVGSLTKFLSLAQTAWVGRFLVWLALAGGWVALAGPMVAGLRGTIWSGLFFLALSATGNLSGEWLIGGVEAKGFAYAALFAGLACAGASQWKRAALWCGVAVSFHPVVGAWGGLALMFALGWLLWEGRLTAGDSGDLGVTAAVAPQRGGQLAAALAAAALFLLVSLPGLIPALALIVHGAPADVSRAADALQVFGRLDHHLDPRQFKGFAWGYYAVLLVGWLALRPWRGQNPAQRLFFRFVVGALLIAAGGMAVGFGPRWAGVLKFYPFRLADLFLPIAVAVGVAGGWSRRFEGRRGAWAGHVLAGAAFAWALAAPGNESNPNNWSRERQADWRDVCRWVSVNTPDDALFLTPKYNVTFRWNAERAEYATWKDCPQDATSLVEWDRRLKVIRNWRSIHFEEGFTADALEELRELTGVDYVLGWSGDPYRATAVYANRTFRVYRLVGDQTGN